MTIRNGMTGFVLAVSLAAVVAGCGSSSESLSEVKEAGVGVNALTVNNGLSPNGLARNGLAANGLAVNGLARNGLARNGLLSADFQSWFDGDPATSAAVMTYVVRCAAAAGQTYSYTSPTTGVTYSWSGSLGLAPGWASGLPATVAEEQVITACLAAHVNKYGVHVDISVQGLGATGVPIPVGASELSTYAQREGCFFGNLFTGEGVYAGIDHTIWNSGYSTVRACAFDILGIGPSADCPPVNNVGPCALICQADAKGNYYTSCGTWVNGAWRTYLPITTRILPADVYKCGDGACQFTESCGTGTTYNNCKADCGDCSVTPAAGTSTTQTKTPTSKHNSNSQ